MSQYTMPESGRALGLLGRQGPYFYRSSFQDLAFSSFPRMNEADVGVGDYHRPQRSWGEYLKSHAWPHESWERAGAASGRFRNLSCSYLAHTLPHTFVLRIHTRLRPCCGLDASLLGWHSSWLRATLGLICATTGVLLAPCAAAMQHRFSAAPLCPSEPVCGHCGPAQHHSPRPLRSD